MKYLALVALAATVAQAGPPAKPARGLPPRTWQVRLSALLPDSGRADRAWQLSEDSTTLQFVDRGTAAKGKKSISLDAGRASRLRDRISALSVPRKGEKAAPALGKTCPNRIAVSSDLGKRALCFDRQLKDKQLTALVRELQDLSPAEPALKK